MLLHRKAQSTVEYGMVIAAVVAALLALNFYMQKGIQGKLKESTDQVGKQFDAESGFTDAWQTASSGTTTTTETRNTASGSTTSEISASETVTRGEYGSFGTAPAQHYGGGSVTTP
jgi:hypothetical protein